MTDVILKKQRGEARIYGRLSAECEAATESRDLIAAISNDEVAQYKSEVGLELAECRQLQAESEFECAKCRQLQAEVTELKEDHPALINKIKLNKI